MTYPQSHGEPEHTSPQPQQPQQFQQPQQPAFQPQPSARSGKAPMLLTGLAVGLLLGGGGVGIGWMLTSSEAEGPAADAAAACAAVDRTPGFPADPAENGLDAVLRWNSAVVAAQAAAEIDPAYTSLYESLRKPLQIYQRTFKAEGPELDQAVRAARAACADL